MPDIRTMRVVPVCQDCGKPVGTTKKDKAVRHGFKRHKTAMISDTRHHSQEDGKPCSGSGKEVVYKKANMGYKR
jgi:hypothetical protein